MAIEPPMSSEWLAVMLEEIARRRADERQAQAERLRRREESGVRDEADRESGPGAGARLGAGPTRG